MNIYNLENILVLSHEPNDENFETWILQNEIIPFLQKDIQDENIILYASLPHVFIHSLLIPSITLDSDNINDLLKWNGADPYSTWGQARSSDDVWVEKPLSSTGSTILDQGEQIIYGRSFPGTHSGKLYYELNQIFSHVLDLHYIIERKSWCRLDKFGDIDEMVKIIEIKNLPNNQSGNIISARRAVLEEYACLQNSILLRLYDFTRCRTDKFQGWSNNPSIELTDNQSIFGRIAVQSGIGSYSRGIQFVENTLTKDDIINRACRYNEVEGAKQYVSFIVKNWQTSEIIEMSCDPITTSGLMPVFFRPEVLLKYKSDRDKYYLEDRAIGCRGVWHLKTFDINDAGQVHTYLIYLSHLSYEEQLHWKQYNEPPKAPISTRAFTTDVQGEFYMEYDPLPSLKQKLDEMHRRKPGWWVLRDEDAPRKVHYPFTTGKDEWAEELLSLDQFLIEGFEEKWLREKAITLGRNPEQTFRALKLMKECLIGLGFEDEHAHQIMTPFHILHDLRSLKGHTNGSEAKEKQRLAIEEFGSFRKHFEKLCADCDASLAIIQNALN